MGNHPLLNHIDTLALDGVRDAEGKCANPDSGLLPLF